MDKKNRELKYLNRGGFKWLGSRFAWSVRSDGRGRVLVSLDHFLAVLVNEIYENFDVLRVHVRIDAVTQVGDVVPVAELEKHVLGQLGQLILGKREETSEPVLVVPWS